MRAGESLALAAVALLALGGAPARAADPDPRDAELAELREAVGRLEQRIGELEGQKTAAVSASGAGAWADRLRISGSADLNWLRGQQYGTFHHSGASIYDLRLFLDADLARDVQMGEAKLLRDATFGLELNVTRNGTLFNNLGEVYVDLRGLANQDWLNMQFGRFQIPFGENYLRFSRGHYSDPFIALSAPPPWFWDEGVKVWGKFLEGKLSYNFSVTDGENALSSLANGSQQLSLKLAADPWEWLHLSVSGLRSGTIGSDTSPAFASLWLGEMIPRAFGATFGPPVQAFDHGQPVPPGPNKLNGITVVGGDAIFKAEDARLWLSYGDARIDSSGGSLYDRNLLYWLAEAMFQLRMISPFLSPAYFAFRASGLGTYSNNEGYLLDYRDGAIGYNMSQLDSYALVLGVPFSDFITLKTQYTFQRIALVRGVTDPDVKEAAQHPDFFGMELSVRF
jgi:hypothetical protein